MPDRRMGDQLPRLQHLPSGIVTTEAGDDVIDFARRIGVELDEWQQWCVHQMCAERGDASWAASQTVLLVPRQNGKSAILEMLELAALFLWDEQHVIYSAHLGKTASDHQRRIKSHILRNPDLKASCRILTGKGDERVERTDTGAILEFITRGKKSSRGGSPNRVIFDEAMFLTEDQIQAMLPALSAQSMNEDAAAQMVYTSSAPIAESTVLHRLRKRGIDGEASSMFFAEWSVDSDADHGDRENWYRANPGLGIRISEQWIEENEIGVLSPEAFAVERLGIPEEPAGAHDGPISVEQWRELIDATKGIEIAAARLALDASPGRDFSTFGVAGWRDDGLGFVGVQDTRPGTDWVIPRAVELYAGTQKPIVVVRGSPGASFIPDLTAAGVEVDVMSPTEYAEACGRFIDAVNNNVIRHHDHPRHYGALLAAKTKDAGDGLVVWSRRSSTADITPLTTAAAAWGRVNDKPDEGYSWAFY